jgi:hypothetical protein
MHTYLYVRAEMENKRNKFDSERKILMLWSILEPGKIATLLEVKRVFSLPCLATDRAVLLTSCSMRLTCRTGGTRVDGERPMRFAVAAVVRKR